MATTDQEWDLVVIGGGAAGMGAARTARRRGATVLLVQDGPIGGDCTFTGCIPSKALIAAAARGDAFAAAMAAVRRAVATVAATEDDDAFRREGIEVVHGRASFLSRDQVEVDGRRLCARRVVVATGARPTIPAVEGLRDLAYLTNENVFQLDDLPPSLAVLGGGAIGCELAQAFARLGSRVVVVEALDRILPREEPEASQVVAEALAADGVEIRVGARVRGVEALAPGGAARLHLEGGATVEAARVLVAIGRTPATEDLGLQRIGVATDERGFVVTDDTLRTTVEHVYACGDVVGRLQFTHAADYMGRIAARNALSRVATARYDASSIPWVTFTDPEVGRVGVTEAEAADLGGRVAFLPMSEVDRAVAEGRTRGFVKLVAGPRRGLGNAGGGRILGATVVAHRGGELIDEVALAMRTRMFAGRLAQAIHAYPTWSWAIQKCAAQLFFEIDGRRARPARHASAAH